MILKNGLAEAARFLKSAGVSSKQQVANSAASIS
jgi:hypothetical protein